MRELSLHILDIAQNSVRADSKNVLIEIKELINNNIFEFAIIDDGSGIPNEILKDIRNPFTTTRKTRKVGLGIPLLDSTCRECEGELIINSSNKGTTLKAIMKYTHIDRPPLGDITSTIVNLITSNPKINIKYIHFYNNNFFEISTNYLLQVLEDDSLLSDFSIIKWLKEFIFSNLEEIRK